MFAGISGRLYKTCTRNWPRIFSAEGAMARSESLAGVELFMGSSALNLTPERCTPCEVPYGIG